MGTSATLSSSEVRNRAAALGFLACGITDPSPTPHADRLDAWLANGYAGTMRYLHRQAERRKHPERIVPEARSIVIVLDNYYHPERHPHPPRIAKYARGEDYHRATKRRLDQLAAWLIERGATVARPYVDAGPVPERELAQRAGLGWIGKNTMLIRPGAGSFFFIAAVFTDLALPPDSPFELDRCGSCTRCLDACPTGALVEPRLLDATRCISYLTIEHKGPIPETLLPKLEGWAFGCDICNDVCPWNERFAEPTPHDELRPREVLDDIDFDFFDRMTEAEFDRRFADTPLERPGLHGMRRNLHAVRRDVG
jgi:epoxyqueuosine reductase